MIAVNNRPRFLLDLAEELTWLNDNAGSEVAERWYQELQKTIHFLQEHPHVGRLRTDIKPEGIRSWRIKEFPRWLIFYLAYSDRIVLLRLRAANMNLVVLEMKP